jgi:hypothetical protein
VWAQKQWQASQVQHSYQVHEHSRYITCTTSKGKGCSDQAKEEAKAICTTRHNFYADYVLTWDHKGKVVAKYVGPRTKGKFVKRNVWVLKVLVTNTVGPKSTWVPKRKAKFVL